MCVCVLCVLIILCIPDARVGGARLLEVACSAVDVLVLRARHADYVLCARDAAAGDLVFVVV